VKAGQCIAELEPEEFLARLDQARANMTQAIENRKQLEISLEIYQNTLPAEVSRAESAVKVAAALLAEQKGETGPRMSSAPGYLFKRLKLRLMTPEKINAGLTIFFRADTLLKKNGMGLR